MAVQLTTPHGSIHTTLLSLDSPLSSLVEAVLKENHQLVTAFTALPATLDDWGAERVLRSERGRVWEEGELQGFNEQKILPLSTTIATALNLHTPPSLTRQFSSFLQTQHLQTLSLRLIYRPYRLIITFQSIDGINDRQEWNYHFSDSLTTGDLILALSEELGIRSEAGLELRCEVDGAIPPPTLLSTLLHSSPLILTTAPPTWSARFNRTTPQKSKVENGTTLGGSWRPTSIFGGIWGVAQEQEGEKKEGGGSTIKARPSVDSLPPSSRPSSPPRAATTTTVTARKNRLSSLFGDWTASTEEEGEKRARIVSGPVAIQEQREAVGRFATVGRGSSLAGIGTEEEEEDLEVELERLMDDLGIKGPQRNAMKLLEIDRKRFLIHQHRSTSSSLPLRATKTGPDPSNEGMLVGGLKRFSLVGWAAGGVDAKENEGRGGRMSIYDRSSAVPTTPSTTLDGPIPNSLLPTETGNAWTSWWSSTSTPTGPQSPDSLDTPSSYVAQIQLFSSTTSSSNSISASARGLVKLLIALRVRLSTSKLSWTEEFLEGGGVDVLEEMLGRISAPRGMRDEKSDEDETVQIECIKSLRVLMNTDIGFTHLLTRQSLITYIAYTLSTSSHKLRAQASDLLSALCILSPSIGQLSVLAALSDYRIAHGERFRFEEFFAWIDVRDGEGEEEEGEGVWEFRTAGWGLINALIHAPAEVDERMILREEFSRRGINEIMTALRYLSPPDHLVTQLDLYLSERAEDQRELSERTTEVESTAMEELRLRAEESERQCARLEEALERRSERLEVRSVHDRSRSTGYHDRSRSTETENLSGVIQSLVQKEKQIIQLESEIASLGKNHKSPLDIDIKKERQERTRQVSNLTEEIRRNKLLINELGSTIDDKEKEIKYLKRALESVYARFQSIIDSSSSSSSSSSVTKKTTKGTTTTNVDPDQLVNQTIEALKKKDEEILSLKSENTRLKSSAKRLPITFARTAPPPPSLPPSSSISSPTSLASSEGGMVQGDLASVGRKAPPPPMPPKPIRKLSTLLPLMVEIPESKEDVTPTPSVIIPSSPPPTKNMATTREEKIPEAPTPPPFLAQPKFAGSVIPLASTPPPFIAGSSPTPNPSLAPHRPALPFLGGIKKSTESPLDSRELGRREEEPRRPALPFLAGIAKGSAGLSGGGSFVESEEAREIMTRRPALPFLAGIDKKTPESSASVPSTLDSSEESKENTPRRPALPFLAGIAKKTPESTGTDGEVVRPRLPFLGAIGQPRSAAPPFVAHRPLKPVTPTSTPRIVAPRAPPQKKMKPFFWNKISSDVLGTSIWSDIDTTTALDLPDLEADFSIGALVKPPSKPSSGTKDRVVSLLGLARANNISIMLARFKMSHEGIRDALLRIDDSKVSIDNLLAIKHYIPTTDEIEAIKSFEGDLTSLAASDQYFAQIMIIPRLGERLGCMIYRRKLEMDMEELKPELTILRSAADELKNSGAFKKLLATVLVIGNRLNAETFRGDAEGFQLESLLKLKETRATSASTSTPTLLHYLARTIIRSDPSLFSFLETASHVEAASRISVSTIMASVNSLVNGLATIKEELRILRRIRISPPSDSFIATMETFVGQATPAIEALQRMGAKLDADLKALVRYYGEEDGMKPEEVFGIIVKFSSALLRAEIEVRAADKKSNSATTNSKRSSDSVDAASKSIGRGGLDNAIRDLRSGNGLRRTRVVAQRPLSRVFLDGSNR